MRLFLTLVVLFSFLSFSFSGCTKLDVKGNVQQPAIALTFDDSYVDDWHKILPLLDSFKAKATFYITNYNHFDKSQKQKLRDIQAHGHEIAYHTTNHYDLNEYLKNNKLEVLMKKEIFEGLQRMNKDGYYPKTFAYPFGHHNEVLDTKLLQYFKSVRALNGTNNYAKSLTTGCNNKILYGLGIDESSKRPFDVILKLIHNAYNDKACLVLVAHHVDRKETSLQLPLDKLRRILQEASQTGLKFDTVSEISL